MTRVTAKSIVAGTVADSTSIELFPKPARSLDRGFLTGPRYTAEWHEEQRRRAARIRSGAEPMPARKPTVPGVAPPSAGTPRPRPAGESGRYSIVDGKRVR